MSKDICPICKNEVEDMRHIRIECFYDVKEFVPEIKEELFLKPVDFKSGYLGCTRTYKNGTRDKHFYIKTGEKSYKRTTKQTHIRSERFIEINVYRTLCCKYCRGDFLNIFRNFVNGKFINEEGK